MNSRIGKLWPSAPEISARATPAVNSGRSVTRSPPRSSKLYISLVTMSEVSPSVRANTSVNSNTGTAISA